MRLAGRIIRAYGTQGQLVMGDCMPHFRGFAAGTRVRIGYSASFTEAYTILASKLYGSGQFLIALSNVHSPEEASTLKDKGIFADDETLRACIETPSEARYFDDEIVGCRVVNRDTGETIGTIKEIWDAPANEIWVVDYNGKELLIPVIQDIVKHVNIARKTIAIYLMPGLLETTDDTHHTEERDDEDDKEDGEI